MVRGCLKISALVLAVFVAGCEGMESKPGAKSTPAEGGTSKSMEHMQGAAGLAPPGGLQ